LQKGLTESTISKFDDFENSDLPEELKVVLRILDAFETYPRGVTDELWASALEYYSEAQLVDIVLLAVHTRTQLILKVSGSDVFQEKNRAI
jgi:hypothetical protein